MGAYLTYLLDLANDESRIVKGSLRFVPDPSRAPTTTFVWKVTCDARGAVAVRGRDGKHLRVIATALWNGGLQDRKQKGTTPNPFQWGLIQATLEEAAALRAADPSAHDDTLVEEVRPGDAHPLVDTPSESPDRREEPTTPEGRARRRAREERRMLMWFLPLAVVLLTVFGIGECMKANRRATRTASPPPTPAPVAAKPAPTHQQQVAPYLPGAGVDAGDSLETRVATAESLQAAFALAAPALVPATSGEVAAMQLTHYEVRWSDVEGAAQTTLAKVEKDPAEERGKRLCAAGTIDRIERGDAGGRRIYRGSLTTAEGDRVAFLVMGSTGDLVKRTRGTVCGIVTGTSDGATAVYGMFDLPENRNPTVEKLPE